MSGFRAPNKTGRHLRKAAPFDREKDGKPKSDKVNCNALSETSPGQPKCPRVALPDQNQIKSGCPGLPQSFSSRAGGVYFGKPQKRAHLSE